MASLVIDSYSKLLHGSGAKAHVLGTAVLAALIVAVVGFGAGWVGKGYGRVAAWTAGRITAVQC